MALRCSGRDSHLHRRRKNRNGSMRRSCLSVIISSSGMVTGGRILHHLAQRLPDPRNLVLFIGFQAPGTRGFQIKSKVRRSEDFRGFRSDSRPDRGAGAVQRSCRSAGVAAMAAHVSQPAGDDLSGSWRTRRFGTVAGPDEEGVGMECSDRAVSGEGGSVRPAP